ncbi:unnamed protein product, partial [Discosporangium mesarthrocarpum]
MPRQHHRMGLTSTQSAPGSGPSPVPLGGLGAGPVERESRSASGGYVEMGWPQQQQVFQHQIQQLQEDQETFVDKQHHQQQQPQPQPQRQQPLDLPWQPSQSSHLQDAGLVSSTGSLGGGGAGGTAPVGRVPVRRVSGEHLESLGSTGVGAGAGPSAAPSMVLHFPSQEIYPSQPGLPRCLSGGSTGSNGSGSHHQSHQHQHLHSQHQQQQPPV